MKYKLDSRSMPNQASNIIAQLKDAGITSVLCACDPVMLALGLTPKANEQGYEPEWLTVGPGLRRPGHRRPAHRHAAVAARVRHRLQRRVRAAGPLVPVRRLQAGAADDEPAFGVEEIYYQMYLLAIGLQMAGPEPHARDLRGRACSPTPAAPARVARWGFGRGDYTPTDDFREIWWDPEPHLGAEQPSPAPGSQLNGGAPLRPRPTSPTGPRRYFKEG